jgi:hypothetical protein
MLRGHFPLKPLVGGQIFNPIVTERLADVLDVVAVATFQDGERAADHLKKHRIER